MGDEDEETALELPAEGECALCNDEETTYQENSSGKPYFYCQRLQTAVNLNSVGKQGRPTGTEFAAAHVDVNDDAELNESDDEPEDDDDIDLSDL